MFKLFVANLKMLSRDTQTILFAFLFPLGFTVAVGVANTAELEPVKLALVQQGMDPVAHRVAADLKRDPTFSVKESQSEQRARNVLEESEIDGIIVIPDLSDGGALKLIFDERRAEKLERIAGRLSAFVEGQNLSLAGAERTLDLDVTGLRGARRLGYFDHILPVILMFGIMFSTTVGTGTAVAKNREMKIFKRLRATPFKPSRFMLTEIGSRSTLALLQTCLVLLVAIVFFDSRIAGDALWLVLIVLIGSAIFIALGFLVGSLARSVDAAGGLATLITLPLFFMSGRVGAVELLPAPLQVLPDYLPLNPLVDAMRTVILDGTNPFTRPRDMALALTWMLGASIASASIFRFSDMPQRRKAK